MNYRRKPLSVKAIRWMGNGNRQEDLEHVWKFCPKAAWVGVGIFARLIVPTPDGDTRCVEGDWIVKDKGGFFTVYTDPDFQELYESA